MVERCIFNMFAVFVVLFSRSIKCRWANYEAAKIRSAKVRQSKQLRHKFRHATSEPVGCVTGLVRAEVSIEDA